MTKLTVLERKPEVDFAALAANGMLFSHWANKFGSRTAVVASNGTRSFAELDANANRFLALLRSHRIPHGSAVALVLPNVPEFLEVWLACQRGGLRLVPINWHLAASDLDYILADCEAVAWVVHADFAATLALLERPAPALAFVVGGLVPGFDDYAGAIAPMSADDPVTPMLGMPMLYTSGTTGQPKGVVRSKPIAIPPLRDGTIYDYRDGDRNLLCGPAYHAGPLTFDIAIPLASGAGLVMMRKFDPEAALRLIEDHRVTHAHMVSTMFRRLLDLPPAVRHRYDLSSLRLVTHGAAPTPPDVKLAMIEWLGPILYEYYGATEASPGIAITSEEWLRKPGSVGKIPSGDIVRIVQEDGTSANPGTAGRVFYYNNPLAPVRYHHAEAKNRETFVGDYYTVGDIGFVDEDGYLFLTGRSAEVIISGGVNIYPQEIDNVMAGHPAVRQSCAVGVPDVEWGEAVRLVVSLKPGFHAGSDLSADLLAFARAALASYMCPRSIDFVAWVPESDAGKTLRAEVRKRYWPEQGAQI